MPSISIWSIAARVLSLIVVACGAMWGVHSLRGAIGAPRAGVSGQTRPLVSVAVGLAWPIAIVQWAALSIGVVLLALSTEAGSVPWGAIAWWLAVAFPCVLLSWTVLMSALTWGRRRQSRLDEERVS